MAGYDLRRFETAFSLYKVHFCCSRNSFDRQYSRAFRLTDDVLSKGKVDLLFVEAAVNDDTNGFSAIEQVRGMEGIVRHALVSNPSMDIMMLHFIYDPFIPKLDKGQMPDVILNHERVANHYLLPSVNLASEIAARRRSGEFTWEQFGGTHPHPLGHA